MAVTVVLLGVLLAGLEVQVVRVMVLPVRLLAVVVREPQFLTLIMAERELLQPLAREPI